MKVAGYWCGCHQNPVSDLRSGCVKMCAHACWQVALIMIALHDDWITSIIKSNTKAWIV